MPFPLKSENGIIIQVLYKENKNYRMSMHIYTDSKVDYRADENILSRIREKGIVNPMIIQQDQWMIMNTTTGAKGSKGRIPFSGKVDSTETIQFVLKGHNMIPTYDPFNFVAYYDIASMGVVFRMR